MEIKTWEDAEQVVQEIRRLETELASADAGFELQIQELQEAQRKTLTPVRNQVDERRKALETFVRANRDGLNGKSRKLVGGTVSLRSTAPTIRFEKSAAHTLQLLRVRGLTTCIRVIEEVDRKALQALSASELRLVGARVERDENFVLKLQK